jgi:hypothetical protein
MNADMMAPLPPVMPATLPAPCPRRAHTQIGFGISVTQGYGLLVMRQPNAPSGW